MTVVTRSELEEQLARWFQAEDLPAEEIERLHRAWQEREKDRLYLNTLRRQFDPSNRVAGGTAWWEERQKGRHGKVIPITTADLLDMWLSFDPLAEGPAPRPWCPDILVGHWRLIGSGENRGDLIPPAAPREWILQADGRLETIGDPEHEDWTWCAHRHTDLDLWLYVPEESAPDVWYIRRLEGGEMDVYPPDADAFERWHKRS